MLRSIVTLSVLLLLAPLHASQEETAPADVRHLVDDDPHKAYYLLLPEKPRKKLHLVVALPGGNGQAADFLPWMKRVRDGLGKDYALAVVSAPQWSKEQTENVVWVTDYWRKSRYPDAKWSAEALAEEVLADASRRLPKKPASATLFGWSSAGPVVYAAATQKKTPFDGFVVHCSVFKPDQMGKLKNARKRRFYLLQGTEDTVTRLRWAEEAEEALEKEKAVVELEAYAGGHGWSMPDPFGTLKRALEWVRD